jgi:hypothetical protein
LALAQAGPHAPRTSACTLQPRSPACLPCLPALAAPADKARDFGAGPLFNQILPLLMSPTLEDQERHLLVKVRWAGLR